MTQQKKLNVVHLTSENFPTSNISRNQLKSSSDDGIDNKLSEYSKGSYSKDQYLNDDKIQIQKKINRITLSESPEFRKKQVKVNRNKNNFGNIDTVGTTEPTQIQLITSEQSQSFSFKENHKSSTMIVDTKIESKDCKISNKDSYDNLSSERSYLKQKSMIEPKIL